MPGGSVMADDVPMRAAKSKRKSRAFILESVMTMPTKVVMEY